MANQETKINLNKAAKFIADYRSSKAWSQNQIAEKLGVSRVTVTRWENGEAKPSTLALRQFEKMINEDSDIIENISFNSPSTKKIKATPFLHEKQTREILSSPYVTNGPKDQNSFEDGITLLV